MAVQFYSNISCTGDVLTECTDFQRTLNYEYLMVIYAVSSCTAYAHLNVPRRKLYASNTIDCFCVMHVFMMRDMR